jgi:hypothetical protein
MKFLDEMFMLDNIAKTIREVMWVVFVIIIIKYYGLETITKSVDSDQTSN